MGLKNKNKVIDILNEIMRYELSGVVRYTHYALMVTGRDRLSLTQFFKEQATESLLHAQQAGELVTGLDGHPSLEISIIEESNKIRNIETILGSDKSIYLPKDSVDKILMVDVYHEFNFPVEIIESIKNTLKPNGKLFLIEYRGEDSSVPIKKIHKMTEKQAIKEMEAAGFKLKENIGNLPWQHCMIFEKE